MKKFLVITGLIFATPALASQNPYAVKEVDKITHNSAITSTTLVDNSFCQVKQSVNNGVTRQAPCDNTSFSVLPGDRIFIEIYDKDHSLQYGMDIKNVDLNSGIATFIPKEIFINGKGFPATGHCTSDVNAGSLDCELQMELKNSIHQSIHTSGGPKRIVNR